MAGQTAVSWNRSARSPGVTLGRAGYEPLRKTKRTSGGSTASRGRYRWGVGDYKQLVRRLVDEGVNRRSTDVLDEVAERAFADVARRWISPFRGFAVVVTAPDRLRQELRGLPVQRRYDCLLGGLLNDLANLSRERVRQVGLL